MIARLFDIDTRNMLPKNSEKFPKFVDTKQRNAFVLTWNNPPALEQAQVVLGDLKSQKSELGTVYYCYGHEGLDPGKTPHLQIYLYTGPWYTTCRAIYMQIQRAGYYANVEAAKGKSKLRK